jgi:hypothetical protein
VTHPLTPTRRIGQVISVSMTPTPTVEVQLGGDTTTTVFAPFLDSYPPNVGDYVVVLENQGDHVVLGSVGSSGMAFDAIGPGSNTDCTGSLTTIVNLAVNVVSGRKYRVAGFAIGTQVTVAGRAVVRILAGGSEIGPSVRPIDQLNAAVNETIGGYAAWRYTATSTASITFSMAGNASSGAFRVLANASQITVEDNGF